MAGTELIALWRARADILEPYAEGVARALRTCADEREAEMAAEASDTVTPAEGAILSGYTADALGKMIRDGRLRNVGTKRRPKIPRADLPKKPRRGREDSGVMSFEEMAVRMAVGSRKR